MCVRERTSAEAESLCREMGGRLCTAAELEQDEGNPAAAVFSVAGSSVFGGDGKMTISALEKFGEVKAVSIPRISTLHNRKAKLDFIDNFQFSIV